MTAPRRFWTRAAVAAHPDGWAVSLDGKTALTPARAALATRHKNLAQAVAAEWDAVGEILDPRALPLTGYLNAVIDRVRPNRGRFAADVAQFAGAELICYRADSPAALVARQRAGWDPILDWMTERYDIRLACGLGVTPIRQSPETLVRLAAAIDAFDEYRLTAALKLTGVTKSLALTLAVVAGARDAMTAYDLSRIDEAFQTEHWGEDAEAARRVAREREDVAAAAAFLSALD